MITNSVEFRSAKAHAAQFEETLANLRADTGEMGCPSPIHGWVR